MDPRYSIPGSGLNLRDLIFRKFHEATNLPLPPEALEEGLGETLQDSPGSPLASSLGFPVKEATRRILQNRLANVIPISDKVKAYLYRFQREFKPEEEVYRRGGEYYFPASKEAAETGEGLLQTYAKSHASPDFAEGGNILKLAEAEIKNPIISHTPVDYKSSIQKLAGKDTFYRVQKAIQEISNNPKIYRRLTGASNKEIEAAKGAAASYDALLDLAKKKFLERSGADAFIRGRKNPVSLNFPNDPPFAIPEVFLTNPRSVENVRYATPYGP